MKKICLLLAFLTVLSFNVYAKTGDVAGDYFSTDIVTSLNGLEIDSINIGGKTLICAERMMYYSFSAEWNDAERTLKINSVPQALNGTPPSKCGTKDGTVGKKLGNYYETDIKTYLDGELITAYNVGGTTFISAEETANMGYRVKWDGEKRTLDITSPDRAGYVYSVSLSKSKSDMEEGKGSFSIDYTKDGVTGTDDADRFDCVISCNGKGYGISMGFYQNQCLFTSSLLLDKLNSFKYSDVYGEICKPEEKYDITDKSVKISINGYEAKNIAVSSSRGNGHVDYYFAFDGVPIFAKNEIESIHFSVDENKDSEKYEFLFEKDELSEAVSALKKSPNDYMHGCYQTEDYFIINMKEERSWGVYGDGLYIVNRKNGEVSEDILNQVRKYEGFDFDALNVFDYTHIQGTPENHLFIGVSSEKAKSKFFVELDSGEVEIAVS